MKLLRRYFQLPWYWLRAFGCDGATLLLGLRGVTPYFRDYISLCRQFKGLQKGWPIRPSMPCLHDRYAQSGMASGHYFHQDLLVAKRVYERKPRRHVDVGSSVAGFVAHVAVFRKIEVLDIRPLVSAASNIVFCQCDLTMMPTEYEGCCDSLSCLHALEHFGLGRYSDRIDAEGHIKGLESLYKLLEDGGILYLSVPIGRQRIEFNAHRVFAVATVLALIKGNFEVVNFSYVDDSGVLHESVELDSVMIATNYGLNYGCGIFECKKTSTI